MCSNVAWYLEFSEFWRPVVVRIVFNICFDPLAWLFEAFRPLTLCAEAGCLLSPVVKEKTSSPRTFFMINEQQKPHSKF